MFKKWNELESFSDIKQTYEMQQLYIANLESKIMKSKRGYKNGKSKWNIRNWFKRYFATRTCRKFKKHECKDLIMGGNAVESAAMGTHSEAYSRKCPIY